MWRKGTGFNASPADQGRDIEATDCRKDIDGSTQKDLWFVECKHYKKGLPPDQLINGLTWAQAMRPHTLLIVTSSFLSNPAKNYLESYETENKPHFRIKIWEGKDLDDLTAESITLRKKYCLPLELPFLEQLNKYHLIYVTRFCLNSVADFIGIMDNLNPKLRDKAFGYTYLEYINPPFREPVNGEEQLIDLINGPVNYSSFRQKLLTDKQNKNPRIVQNLVISALMVTFSLADKSSIRDKINANLQIAENIEKKATQENVSEKERELQLSVVKMCRELVAKMPQQTDEYYEAYQYLCKNLVRKLLIEA
jgi:hypothetical protein